MPQKDSAEKAIRDIRRKTRRKFSAEEKIRIVLEGLRGEESIASLCRREGIAANLYDRWSKDFLEAGKKRLRLKRWKRAGDLARPYWRGRVPIHTGRLSHRQQYETDGVFGRDTLGDSVGRGVPPTQQRNVLPDPALQAEMRINNDSETGSTCSGNAGHVD